MGDKMTGTKLIRPKEGRMFFGVAAGLGDYFNIDPVIIRIIFVILTIWGGAGIILYIIGIFVIPDEKNDEIKKEAEDIKAKKNEYRGKVQAVAEEVKNSHLDKRYDNSQILGLILLALGIILLLSNIVDWLNWDKLWPLLLVIIGLVIIANRKGGK